MPRVENLRIGPSTDREADYGPVVTGQALERIRDYVEVGINEGATLAVDGRDFKMQGYENGYFMGGCLFDNVTKDMRIYKEEIFGPVLTAIPFKDEADALALANDVQYGLTGYIWTKDVTRAHRFAQKLDAGMIWINSQNVILMTV